MHRLDAVSWVLTLCSSLRLSQAKTLADLVAAALHVERVSLANIGRQLLGAVKHGIKRVWRFCDHPRIEIDDAMRGVVERLCRRRQKPLLIALDWTEFRHFHTLMAAVVQKGRALPLLWSSYPEWRLAKSQNNLEEGLLTLLRDMIPKTVPVIILADRGFGRTAMAKFCQGLKFRYLIRIKPDVWVRHKSFTGKLLDYPVKKGIRRVLKGVRYRKDAAVTQDVVIRWKPGLPKKRDEPWFLMTDLGEKTAVKLTELYAQRMTVEELFRDDKNLRNGFSLRQTQVKKAERLDRLLLILALAYWLLVGIGWLARGLYRPGTWCSSQDEGQCSVFTIGRIMLRRMEVTAEQAFAAAMRATEEAAPKLGTT